MPEQLLSLALALHTATDAFNARTTTANAAAGPAAVQRPSWRLRIGIARGGVVAGGLGTQRRRCHFFGGAVAEAAQLAWKCPAGQTRVQRSVARAEAAGAFKFIRVEIAGEERQAGAARAAGAEGVMRLCGRRRLSAFL
jgi:class 3 adenylate cyclase